MKIKLLFFALLLNTAYGQEVHVSFESSDKIAFNKDVLGANVNFLSRPYGVKNSEVIKLAKELKLYLWRYPGGTWSNYWNWETGTFMDNDLMQKYTPLKKLEHAIPGQSENVEIYHDGKVSIEDYVQLTRQTGTDIIFVANVYTDYPDHLAEFVKRDKEKNYGIKYFELGNEFYLKEYQQKYPTVKDYILDAKLFTEKMKAQNGQIEVGVVATGFRFAKNHIQVKENGDIWVENFSNAAWNRGLARENFYDAVIVHDYVIPPVKDINHMTEDELHRFYMARNPAQFPILMKYYKYLFGADVKIWLTEWNIHQAYSDGVIKKRGIDPSMYFYCKTMSHALFTADYIMQMMHFPHNIELANYHVLAAPFLWGLFSPRSPEKENLDKPFYKYLNYYIFLAFSKAMHQADHIAFPEVNGSPIKEGTLEFKGFRYKTITGIGFYQDNVLKTIIILNKDKEQTISLDSLFGEYSMESIWADEAIEGFGKSKANEMKFYPQAHFDTKKVNVSSFTLPKFSFNVIHIN